MKKLLFASLLAAPFFASAQELPQPSPAGTVSQVIGLTKVNISYSRPSAKGRVVFGDLVPYGQVWRTGANKCTTIEFEGPVKFAGTDVKPGRYSLFTIPSEGTWTVILNRNTELWGAEDRKEEEDVLQAKVPAISTGQKPQARPTAALSTRSDAIKHDPASVETLTIGFDAVKDDKALMYLAWENTRVEVPIEADATERALANIKEALAKPDADYRAYHSSARFCVDRGLNLPDALTWAQKSTGLEKKFWNTHTLALAYAANGRYKEAIAAAEESLKLAQEAKNEAYIKMNKEKIEEWGAKLGK